MDALLRYTLYRIVFSVLLVEVILMVSCCIAMVITKFVTRRNRKKQEIDQVELRAILDEYLLNNKPINIVIPKQIGSFRNIVETLETYDHLFKDDRWQEIKEKIVTTYLTPKIKAYAGSFFWFKRQLAARACHLSPKNADLLVLGKLLEDRRYLVRVAAASTIAKISDKALFEKFIKQMVCESKESRFPYRDVLIQTDEEKFHWLEQLLTSTTDKATCAICLDVLSTRYSSDLLPLIKKFVNDTDKDCRIFAIKALGNIPINEAIEILINKLDDSEWTIRAESVMSLHKLHALDAIPKLQRLLSDPVWWVRLKAALALKDLGNPGIKALYAQNLKEEPLAYEIAQYALAIP